MVWGVHITVSSVFVFFACVYSSGGVGMCVWDRVCVTQVCFLCICIPPL